MKTVTEMEQVNWVSGRWHQWPQQQSQRWKPSHRERRPFVGQANWRHLADVPEKTAVGKTKARPEGDVSVGVDRLDSLPEVEHVSLKQLTLHVCMLLALVTGQRGHTFHLLKVVEIKLKESKFTILYSEKHKQSRPGFHVEPAETLAFEHNSRLCSVKR